MFTNSDSAQFYIDQIVFCMAEENSDVSLTFWILPFLVATKIKDEERKIK